MEIEKNVSNGKLGVFAFIGFQTCLNLGNIRLWEKSCFTPLILISNTRSVCFGTARKYRSQWDMTFLWVQKSAYGSVCKFWPQCNQSVRSHKSWKVREASIMSSSTIPRRLNLNFEVNLWWYSCNWEVSLWQRNSNTAKKFGILNNRFGLFLAFSCHCLTFYWNFYLATLTRL